MVLYENNNLEFQPYTQMDTNHSLSYNAHKQTNNSANKTLFFWTITFIEDVCEVA